jgi:hypothetical protein
VEEIIDCIGVALHSFIHLGGTEKLRDFIKGVKEEEPSAIFHALVKVLPQKVCDIAIISAIDV